MAERGSGVASCGKKSGSTRTQKKISLCNKKRWRRVHWKLFLLTGERNLNPAPLVAETGRFDFRSTLGSLQWLATPSWARYMFYRNHFQKRVSKVNVTGLLVANKVVKIIKSQQVVLKCRDLCNNDPGLYDGVDVEIEK